MESARGHTEFWGETTDELEEFENDWKRGYLVSRIPGGNIEMSLTEVEDSKDEESEIRRNRGQFPM